MEEKKNSFFSVALCNQVPGNPCSPNMCPSVLLHVRGSTHLVPALHLLHAAEGPGSRQCTGWGPPTETSTITFGEQCPPIIQVALNSPSSEAMLTYISNKILYSQHLVSAKQLQMLVKDRSEKKNQPTIKPLRRKITRKFFLIPLLLWSAVLSWQGAHRASFSKHTLPYALLHLLRRALHEKVCITVHTHFDSSGKLLGWGRLLPNPFEGDSDKFNLSLWISQYLFLVQEIVWPFVFIKIKTASLPWRCQYFFLRWVGTTLFDRLVNTLLPQEVPFSSL